LTENTNFRKKYGKKLVSLVLSAFTFLKNIPDRVSAFWRTFWLPRSFAAGIPPLAVLLSES